jgi:hypothetical protein
MVILFRICGRTIPPNAGDRVSEAGIDHFVIAIIEIALFVMAVTSRPHPL